jgi:hypothetical protein
MALGRIAFEAVNEPGLGRAEGEPAAPSLLQSNKELPAAVHHLVVQVVTSLKLDLEREPAAQRVVRAALHASDV